VKRFEYIRNPSQIERESFARIRAQTNLDHLDANQQQIALRLVHTCGDPGIVEKIYFSTSAPSAGVEALGTGASVLCDVEMVRHGLSQRYLSGAVHCFLNADGVAERARHLRETRSMAALSLWPEHLSGSIVAIGNAPTALFRLLEMLSTGTARPALIVAMPVGFVGAKESKEALIAYAANQLHVPCITLRGRRGGSALTAAAVNAVARLAQGIHC
jgi:precorrin-8X/cobalt-precorrin-8 methylmutase